MYRLTSTAGVDEQLPTAPEVLDALDAHLREQLVDAGRPVHIDWTITPPVGPIVTGWAGTPGNDPGMGANLDALRHGLAQD